MDFNKRLLSLQAELNPTQALLLSRPSDVYYFSGFYPNVPGERSACILITHTQVQLLIQHFLPIPKQFPGAVIALSTTPHKLAEHIQTIQKTVGIAELSADFSDLTVDEYLGLQQINGLRLLSLERKTIWRLRQIKDKQELLLMNKARQKTKQVLQRTIANLCLGQSELEIADSIAAAIRQESGYDLAFPSIVAFDEHSAVPHHQPGQRKLRHGSVVLIDMGASYQHYCADMTRTVFFRHTGMSDTNAIKEKAKAFKRVFQSVKGAYDHTAAFLDNSTSPITAADLDHACRNYLSELGLADYFIHTTGHGLGIDIHEPPSLYKTNTSQLQSGMAITIEPGVYLPGKFGVRFENTLFI